MTHTTDELVTEAADSVQALPSSSPSAALPPTTDQLSTSPLAPPPSPPPPAQKITVTTPSKTEEPTPFLPMAFVFLLAAGFFLFSTNEGRQFFANNTIAVISAAALFIVGVASYFSFEKVKTWLNATTGRQGAALTFGAIPALLGVVVGISFLHPRWQIFVIRVGFITMACLLPAVMYYLFIVTRRESLFNEFIANMTRLGLFSPRWMPPQPPTLNGRWETEQERLRRVFASLQKFEALYGPISEGVTTEVLQAQKPSTSTDASVRSLGRTTVTSVFASEAAVPVLVATFLIALLWVLALPPVDLPLVAALLPLADSGSASMAFDSGIAPWRAALTPNISPVIAAFLGAYFFSLQLLFRRFVRRDLRSTAYVGLLMRILLAVIGVWVLAWMGPLFLSPDLTRYLVVVAFVIGVFPRVLLQIIEGSMKKLVPSAVLPSLQPELPISELDGLTVWHEARLEDEDIENIPNMATADILDLMLNTRFPPERIVEWVDQAILYTAVGPISDKKKSTDSVRQKLGSLRTATALTEAYQRAAGHHNDLVDFQKLLPTTPRSEMRTLVDALDTSSNLQMIRVWRGLGPLNVSRGLGPIPT